LKGNKTNELWRYVAATAAGTGLPERSGVMADRSAPRAAAFAVARPATGAAPVSYSLPQAGPARVTVFDVAGRTVTQQALTGRSGQMRLDLSRLSAGVYLVRCDATGFTATRKLVID
jgi:hypothetical protein